MDINREAVIIEKRMQELAEATMVNEEIWRAVYTREDKIAKQMIIRWMEEAGLLVYEDSVGNLFGRLDGKKRDVILVGSHLDTVKNGGIYDGAAGILIAIASIRRLYKECGIPEKTIEVVALIEEEGSRYGSSYLGSKAITGQINEADLNEKDVEGISIKEAMKEAGYDSKCLKDSVRKDVISFIELHIEQGPILDREAIQIGIVESVVGLVSYDITVKGIQNHAGTTPMEMRRDPVLAVSNLIGGITRKVKSISDTATFTVGRVGSLPGISNVIAGSVSFSIDFRDGDKQNLTQIEEMILDDLNNLSESGFVVNKERQCYEMPVSLHPTIVDAIEWSARDTGKSFKRMNSGAGHDAQVFAAAIPTGMIFIPSINGISHAPGEQTTTTALADGLTVLKKTLEKLAVSN